MPRGDGTDPRGQGPGTGRGMGQGSGGKGRGLVLIMEHEIHTHPFIKLLFNVRMTMVGSADAKEFLGAGLEPFKKVFSKVHLSHSASKKSRLLRCTK